MICASIFMLRNEFNFIHKGLIETGFVPLPREMSFAAEDLTEWQRKYDFVTFPTENGDRVDKDVIPGQGREAKKLSRCFISWKQQFNFYYPVWCL